MNRISKFSIIMLTLSIIMGMNPMCTNASDIFTEVQETIIYTPAEQAIYDKVNELAEAKVILNQYMNVNGLTKEDICDNPYINTLLHNIDSVKEELVAMGAKPSEEVLTSLFFDSPIEINGVLIEDFAEFEERYGSSFDLWGVSKTVNASYGTYETYEIMIQDTALNDILMTHVSQNGSAGWDIFTAGSSAAEVAEDNINSAVFDRAIEEVAKRNNISKKVRWLTNAITVIKEIISAGMGININDPITSSGGSKSYEVFCDSAPTIHFIYVKDNNTGAWQHTYTTNRAAVLERHEWYIVVSQDGRPYVLDDDQVVYDETILPEEFGYRLTNAISAFRNEKSLYIDKLNGYEFVIRNTSGASDSHEVFSLDITCPETKDDLFRYGM